MSVPFSLVMLVLLIFAALRDIVSRTIPDSIALLIAFTGAFARILDGPSALAISVGTASLLFVVLLITFYRGFIGGGDVKLMAALCIGLSPFDSYRFVIATAVSGGVLAVAYLVLSLSPRGPRKTRRTPLLRRIVAVESWRIRKRGPLPYGVAIAAGGAFVLLQPGNL